MPTRILRDGILDSKAFNRLSDTGQIFYYRLISLVDDYGRYEADLEILRSRLFGRMLERWPLERVDEALDEVSNARCTRGISALVTVYSRDERKYLQISNFNQRVQSKEKFPGPDSPRATVADGDSPLRATRARSESESKADADSESEKNSSSPAAAGDGQSSPNEAKGFALQPPEHHAPSKAEKLQWFKELWDLYWRKVGKRAARDAFFAKVKTKDDWEIVKAAIVAQTSEMLGREPRHRPYLATWLIQERMFDEAPPARVGPAMDDKYQRRRDEALQIAEFLRNK